MLLPPSAMVRGLVVKTKILLHREAKRVECRFSSKVAGGADWPEKSRNEIINGAGKKEESSCWIPHPRTGIYFPKGHESVMDDVPMGAASPNRPYWLRKVDGVEKPDHNTPPDHYFHMILDEF